MHPACVRFPVPPGSALGGEKGLPGNLAWRTDLWSWDAIVEETHQQEIQWFTATSLAVSQSAGRWDSEPSFAKSF